MLQVITNPKWVDTKWHTRRQSSLARFKQTRRWAKVAVLCLLLAATVYGQPAPPASPAPPTVIHGTVTDGNNQKLPDVTVRLRNLQSKTIELTTTTDQNGEFSFKVKPEVAYVVEIANKRGAVVAVSNIVLAHSGDVATAALSIPGATVTASGGFSSATGAVILAAMSTGLTAFEAGAAPPVSPEK